jgi:hypothetical protein
MPISDYATAFFLARRNRVTLQDTRTESRDRDCNFKSLPGLGHQYPRRFGSRACRLAASGQEQRVMMQGMVRSAMQQIWKEKARRSRAFDEYIFRLVYFASFAI